EHGGAAALAGMLASKYFFFLTPIPVAFYLWVRPQTRWRLSARRWLQLILVAFGFFVCVNWSPFLPSTWEYAKSYTTGQQTVHGSLFFMGRIYHNLLEYGLGGTPPWFYAVFAAVKLAPATFLCAAAGLAIAVVQRRPAHRLMLSWVAIWFLVHSLSGSKWGRFFVSVLPAFLIFAGAAAAQVLDRLRMPAARWAHLLRGRPGGAALLPQPGRSGQPFPARAVARRAGPRPRGGESVPPAPGRDAVPGRRIFRSRTVGPALRGKFWPESWRSRTWWWERAPKRSRASWYRCTTPGGSPTERNSIPRRTAGSRFSFRSDAAR